MLEVNKVVKRFGGLVAVNEVDFQVKKGEIVGLVGPNGAGKTTLLNVINGIYHPDSGDIKFEGEDITRLRPDQICRRGFGRTFQLIKIFPGMTALENVTAGVIFGKPGMKISLEEAREKAGEALDFVRFPLSKDTLAKNLNVIQSKLVELARALATKPKILLLDEVTTGLNPREGAEMIELIQNMRKSGITIIQVEHVMRVIMKLCDRIVVLHHGSKIAEGTPKEISTDEEVIKAYLGEKYLF